MATSKTVAFRLEGAVYAQISKWAGGENMSATTYLQRLVRDHVADRSTHSPDDAVHKSLSDRLLERAWQRAKDLEHQFDEHFTLRVLDALFADPDFVRDYEQEIGANCMMRGNPAKSSLNMNLGWHIKRAAYAQAMKDAQGRPCRVQVSNRPFSSYTKLERIERTSS